MEIYIITQEEMEVMNAMQIVAQYRATHADKGFYKLADTLKQFLEITSRPFKCNKCGAEHKFL